MHELIKDYKGHGVFTFGTDLQTTFDFVLHLPPTPDCKILTSDKTSTPDSFRVMQKNLEQRPLECSLDGKTDDGGKITCKKLLVDKINYHSDVTHGSGISIELLPADEVRIDYPCSSSGEQNVYLLTNLLFGGNEVIQKGQQLDRARSNVEINDIKLIFTRLLPYDETKQRLKNSNHAIVTTEVTSTANREVKEELDQLIWPISYLCTLGQHCFVSPLYSAVRSGGSWKKISYLPVKTYPPYIFDPCIDFGYQGENDFKRYLEQCYPGYKKWADTLRLDAVIEYAVSASSTHVVDLSYLLLCIAFECLAENGKEYLESIGADFLLSSLEQNKKVLQEFMKSHMVEISDEDLQNLAKSVSYNQPSLKEKLSKIFKEFHVSFNDDDLNEFLGIRNILVHTGMFPKNMGSAHEKTQQLKDFFDKTLLTIIGYRGGRYILRSKDFKPTTLD